MSGVDLLALASMVEASAEANQALDVMILALTRPTDFEDENEARQYADPRYVSAMNRADWHYMSDIGLRRYTASLDAAMSLVPEGWAVSLASWARPKNPVRAWRASLEDIPVAPFKPTDFRSGRSEAANPALALCAAALRARAQQEPSA